MTKIKDVFDYLKLADKEDIYTSLIHDAFSESESFRMHFCVYFGAQPDPKAKLLQRHPFYIESKIAQRKINKDEKVSEVHHRHARQIPDLTLVTQDKICIIESKLFSPEGSYQTERYGNLDFLESIKKDKKLSSLKLDHVRLNPKRSKSKEDQCLFYMTINGDRAANEAFMAITWSQLVEDVFIDLGEFNEPLRSILIQMRERFVSYPILKEEIIEHKADQSLDAFLRHSSKHFLLDKDYLLFAYFDQLRNIQEHLKDHTGVHIEFATVLGTRQLTITTQEWENPSIEEVLLNVPCGTSVDTLLNLPMLGHYPFSKLIIKVINNKKISVCINYEPNPYLSDAKMIKNYGIKIKERLKQGKVQFEQALYDIGIQPSSTLLQVAKTEFSKKDKDLVEKVTDQIKTYCMAIDQLIEKENPHESSPAQR